MNRIHHSFLNSRNKPATNERGRERERGGRGGEGERGRRLNIILNASCL
jgi:hypothetical protein